MNRIICKFIYKDESLGDIIVKPYKSSRHIKFRISDGTVTATVPYGIEFNDFISDLNVLKPEISSGLAAQKVEFKEGTVFSSYWLSVTLESGNVGSYTISGKDDKYVIKASVGCNDVDLIKNGIYIAMKHRARQVLPSLVKGLALRHGFAYNIVKVNSSRGRWGSCSAGGNINLSCSLMALPRHLTEYVILHELCHTKYMAHNDNFYRLLDQCSDGKSESMRAELRNYRTWISHSPADDGK